MEEDGKAFVGNEGWKGMVEVKYLREPTAQQTYVTTAALAGEKAVASAAESSGRCASLMRG